MDRKTITAMLLAFMVVKTPVSLAEVQAYAAPQNKEANAVSEANIAENINKTATKNDILTKEDKAQAQMAEYHKQLEAEAARIAAEEQARKAAEAAKQAAEAAAKVAALQQTGMRGDFTTIYQAASKRFGVPWQLLAAVHKIETGQRGDTTVTSYAGAQGPMQFLPSTFNAYAQDGDGDGVARINDVDDAIFTAAAYLAANGANRGDYVNALWHYNHDMGYVNTVLGTARSLGM